MTATEDHITPHIVQTEIDGLPYAYQRSVLRTDPDRLSDTLRDIRAIQKGLDPRLKNLKVESHPHKKRGFLELTGPGVDALALLDALRAKKLKAELGVEPAYLADDPDPTSEIVGMTVRHGHGTTREGVYLVGFAPRARSTADLEAGRRPVVAVLDTQVREHPWLGDGEEDDAFWQDACSLEDGWTPNFGVPEETSADGRLSHAGHGTFIAGVVRLLAPDARVLSIPVMYGNGVVEDEHLLHALCWLRDRVTSAVDEQTDRFVDVVNLSFGRYLRPGEEAQHSEELRTVLGELARLGVRVVASAGNRPVKKRVFPAILGDSESATDHTALVSVGARDPDGTLAAYTSTGDWVTITAPGTSVVSTLPRFDHTEFPLRDDLTKKGKPKYPDPNFQASGFGEWSGTSFAAAWVSASIAAKLLEQATPGSLVDNSPAAAGARATLVLSAVVADIEEWVASHGVVN